MSDDALLQISLRNRIDLYEKAVALRREGLTNRRVSESLGVSMDAIGCWLGNGPEGVSRYEADPRPSRDLACVVGLYLGDGKDAGEELVRFELADREQPECVGGPVAGSRPHYERKGRKWAGIEEEG